MEKETINDQYKRHKIIKGLAEMFAPGANSEKINLNFHLASRELECGCFFDY